ncbi:MAG: hypothetical protein JXC85_03365 [Candidatus Aenigmarchaeota archaeon]|nr:hypothetical protein [Candidatus Aenigmarchaeota archaeon]
MKALGPSVILYAAYASLLYLVAYFAEAYLAFFQPDAILYPVQIIQLVLGVITYLGWMEVGRRFKNRLMLNVSMVAVWLVPVSGLLNIVISSSGSINVIYAFVSGLVMGLIVAVFGTALLGLRKRFGDLARVTGWLDIIMGVCLLSFILLPVAVIIMPPIVILEAIVLFRAYKKAARGPLGLTGLFHKFF